ncbi:antitoxin [Mycobacterium avium subsp. avium 10-9275]|nr:antitoxin [Mycobacterium avium subsp. silvaticum ATCC 49884]ETB10977.1 antitoxin [Mycobacterium avium subsp. avium 10-9275]ETB17071.1 antitoxin [Mycobacterium avium subsp. avium 11-4751]
MWRADGQSGGQTTGVSRIFPRLTQPAGKRAIPIIGMVSVVGKNTSFSLDEHYSAFIEREVASGRYRSASDVVRSALRLLEDRETQLRALRAALEAGERSGTSTPFDFDTFLDRKRTEASDGR